MHQRTSICDQIFIVWKSTEEWQFSVVILTVQCGDIDSSCGDIDISVWWYWQFSVEILTVQCGDTDSSVWWYWQFSVVILTVQSVCWYYEPKESSRMDLKIRRRADECCAFGAGIDCNTLRSRYISVFGTTEESELMKVRPKWSWRRESSRNI
jgi:hypothetical protein